MALAAKRRVVINAGRRRRKGWSLFGKKTTFHAKRTKSGSFRRRKNRSMTPKQIKFFGTPAQKAALRNSRRRKLNSSRARNTASRSRSYLPRKHRARAKNPGDILSLVLNPGGRRKEKSMAKSTKRSRAARKAWRTRMRRARTNPARRSRPRHHSYRHRARANRRNPSRRHHYRRHHHNRRNRRNPGGFGGGGEGSFQNAITQGLSFMGGYFGSKFVTQLVMGSANTGVQGYLGNAAATAGLAIVAQMFPPTKKFAMALVAGGATQILARILSDNTAFGQLTSSLGVGDYQMQNFVTPQRLVAPLESAQIEIPAGWGGGTAPVAISTAAPPGTQPSTTAAAHPALSGYNTQGLGRGMYSSAGLYS